MNELIDITDGVYTKEELIPKYGNTSFKSAKL